MTSKHCWLAALAVASAATGISGCGTGSDPTGSSAPRVAACAAPPTSMRSTPLVAVLATEGTPSAVLRPQRAATLATVVAGAQNLGAQFVLNGVASGIGAPSMLVDTALVAEGPNNLIRELDMSCKSRTIEGRYRQLTSGPGTRTVDVISALAELHDDLETLVHGDVQVVVIGPAATRTELLGGQTLDLGDPRTLADPARAIDRLAQAGLNFECRGWRVSMVGGSYTAQGVPLAPAQDSALAQFWKRYFAHCGGALVAYGTALASFPPQGGPISSADYRMIPISVTRRGHTVVATLTGSVFFATNSAVLRSSASAALASLLPLLATARGTIEIVGYTDSRGTDATNEPLSQRRASAVARWISDRIHLAAGRFVVRGLGARDPVASNDTAIGRARNRRVVITFERP